MRWLKSGGFLRFLAVFRSFLGVFLMFGMLFFLLCVAELWVGACCDGFVCGVGC